MMSKKEKSLVEKAAQELLDRLGVVTKVAVSEDEGNVFQVDISGEDLGILIGYHGETLGALQLIISLMVYHRLGSWQPLVVDVGGWRQKRKETLEKLAQRTAERAKFVGEDQELAPMAPFERRIVHLTLSDDPKVETESLGEGSDRRVVVKLKK